MLLRKGGIIHKVYLYIVHDIAYDISNNIGKDKRRNSMHHDMRERLRQTIDLFKQKGAISRENALPLDELGLPSVFEYFMDSPMGERLPFQEVDGKYYLDEDGVDEYKEAAFPIPPMTRWAKQTARVPKGYLRYRVLLLLKEKPMAGSEIMSRIEEETGGRYSPSPGSIYPLLKKLKESGLAEELPTIDGMKRYELTDMGHAFLEEQSGQFEKMKQRLSSGPMSVPPFLDLPDEIDYLRDSARRLLHALLAVTMELTDHPESEVAEKLESLMTGAAEEAERLLAELKS